MSELCCAKNTETYRTLLVMNKDSMAERISGILNEKENFEVCGIFDTRLHIIDTINELQPDVIITESVMPFVDIISFINEVAAFSKKMPKIYILTEECSANKVNRLLKLGAAHCIILPLSSENIVQAIESHLESGSKFLEIRIVRIFKELGLSPQTVGYKYLKTMILECMLDPDKFNCVSKRLYPIISTQYGTSSASLERSMRSVIEKAWNNRNNEIWKGYFSCTQYKPTVKEFVAEIMNQFKS